MQEEFVRWKLHTFNSEKRLSKSDCTNRTSLGKPFYATKYSLYTQTGEATGRQKNEKEREGSIWGHMEVSGKCKISPSISKQAVGKAAWSHRQKRNGKYRIEKRS